jgi:hypothetical protein
MTLGAAKQPRGRHEGRPTRSSSIARDLGAIRNACPQTSGGERPRNTTREAFIDFIDRKSGHTTISPQFRSEIVGIAHPCLCRSIC